MHRLTPPAVVLPVAVLLAASLPAPHAARAQQPAAAAQAAPQAAVPVTLTVRARSDSRNGFRPGETIPIELTFASPVRQRYVVDGAIYDRSGRLTIDRFRIEPLEPVADPLLDLFATYQGYMGGGLRTTGTLGDKPFVVTVDLNEWFRFDTPGTYRLSLRSGRVTDETQRTPSARPVMEVDSNTTTFAILPRDAAWEAGEIARAVQVLNDPKAEARGACRALRFLASDAAAAEMVKRYDDRRCQWDFMAGLYSASDRARVVRLMEAGLSAPDQAVSQSYLHTLAVLSVYAQHPELRAPQTTENKGQLIPGGAILKRMDLVTDAEARYAAIAAAALPKKTPSARAATLADLNVLSTAATGAAGDVSVQRQLIASFANLPAERQTRLLEYEWRRVAHADMVPVLRRLADGPGPLGDLALRRLYELDPVDGRTRILRAIANPGPGASLKTLSALPDATLPQMDNVLAAGAEQEFDSVGGVRIPLLHRYASPAVAPRVLSRFGPRVGRMACQPQSYVVAYFLRAAPADGAALLDRVLASRTGTGCYQSVLHDIAALRLTPAIEAAALRHLDDPHPRVVQNAVDTLGQYGSAAARQPLRTRFERWSAEWRGREDELRYKVLEPPDQPGAMQERIESAFIRALGAGQGWLTSADDMNGLRALCVTNGCRSEAQAMAGSAGSTTIRIFTYEDTPGFNMGSLAQYDIRSLETLRVKLRQYAKGTTFTADVSGLDPQMAARARADLTRLAGELGVVIRP